MTAFLRDPAFVVGTQAVTPDPWGACTPVLPLRLTSHAMSDGLQEPAPRGFALHCWKKKKQFKTNLHLHGGCLAYPQGWWPRGWWQVAGEGTLPGLLGTGALPSLPRGNHGLISACINISRQRRDAWCSAKFAGVSTWLSSQQERGQGKQQELYSTSSFIDVSLILSQTSSVWEIRFICHL